MPRPGPRALAAIAALVAAFLCATTLWALWTQWQPFPSLDQWATVGEMRQWDEGNFGIVDLFRQHNEHRLAVPRLLFRLDTLWCAQQGQLVVAVAVLLQLLLMLLLARIWRRARSTAPPTTTTVAVVATLVAFQFAGAQIQNLVEPFQVQFGLVSLAVAAACAALARAATSGNEGRWVLAAIACGLVATGSMASGLLVWPLLLLLGARLHVRRRSWSLLLVCGALATAGYLRGYYTPQLHTDPIAALTRPVPLLHYVAAFLGSTVRLADAAPQVLMATLTGAVGLLLLVGTGWPLVRGGWRVADPDRAPAEAYRAAALAIALFGVGAGLLTGLGRLDFGIEQATSIRYGTTTLLFWSAVLIVASTAVQVGWRRLGAIACAFVVACLCAQQRQQLRTDGWARQSIRRMATAAEALVQDPATIRAIGPPDLLYPLMVPYLQERHRSVFASGRSDRLGRPRAEALPGELLDGCIGAIDDLRPIDDSGWACHGHGWAFVAPLGTAPVEGWFVDGRNIVVGIADFDGRRSDVAIAEPATAGQRIVFHGYCAVAVDSADIALLVRGTDGRLYRGIAPRRAPAELAERSGDPIESLQVTTEGAFRLEPMVSGDQYSSDGPGQGQVTLGGLRSVGTLLLPLCTGPSPFGLTVRIVDQQNGEVLRELWPPTTHWQWRIWRAELPAGAEDRTLAVIVADRGTLPSQWVQVGVPTRGERGR